MTLRSGWSAHIALRSHLQHRLKMLLLTHVDVAADLETCEKRLQALSFFFLEGRLT
jgi:hypothetical protein